MPLKRRRSRIRPTTKALISITKERRKDTKDLAEIAKRDVSSLRKSLADRIKANRKHYGSRGYTAVQGTGYNKTHLILKYGVKHGDPKRVVSALRKDKFIK